MISNKHSKVKTSLICNCRLISPDQEMADAGIFIEDKCIRAIIPAGEMLPKADFTFDAKGQMAVPGFIDIHCHGIGGFDFTSGDPDAVAPIARMKLKEGVTTLLPTTGSFPEERLAGTLRGVAAYQQNSSHLKIPGVHLEGPFINPASCGAMAAERIRSFDIDEIIRLNKIARVMIVTYAVEMEGGIDFTRDLAAMNIIPSCGHSTANYKDFSKAKEAGLKHLTHFCNQMSGLHHREIGLVGAGLTDSDVLLELICDKKHISPDMIKLIFNSREVDQLALITDAVAPSWLPDGKYTCNDHCVEVKNGTVRLLSGNALAGSTLKFYEGLRNVYELTGLPLNQLIKASSLNQALSLGLDRVGRIEADYFADIAILDNDFKPTMVLVNGKFFNLEEDII